MQVEISHCCEAFNNLITVTDKLINETEERDDIIFPSLVLYLLSLITLSNKNHSVHQPQEESRDVYSTAKR